MTPAVVVGIDGGNTKTVAAVATTAGDVLGVAAGTCSDIYAARSAEGPIGVLIDVVRRTLSSAGVSPGAVAATVGSLAGADWPEDFALYRAELRSGTALGGHIEVVNDGVGPLRLGDPRGRGVAVALGTAAAVGARGPDGTVWHASFWLPVGAAEWLGRRALAAVSEAGLGLGPPTSLRSALFELFGTADEEALLHLLTRREGPAATTRWEREAGRALLDQDGEGDPVASDIVADFVRRLAPYAIVAANKVGMDAPFDVVLTGGLLRHPRSSLASRLTSEIGSLDGRANVLTVTAAPVAGAVLEAIALTGAEVTAGLARAVAGTRVLAMPPEPAAPGPGWRGSPGPVPPGTPTGPVLDAATP